MVTEGGARRGEDPTRCGTATRTFDPSDLTRGHGPKRCRAATCPNYAADGCVGLIGKRVFDAESSICRDVLIIRRLSEGEAVTARPPSTTFSRGEHGCGDVSPIGRRARARGDRFGERGEAAIARHVAVVLAA